MNAEGCSRESLIGALLGLSIDVLVHHLGDKTKRTLNLLGHYFVVEKHGRLPVDAVGSFEVFLRAVSG